MGIQDLFFLIFSVLGGLALFIFGMNVMTDGLRAAAGSRIRTILHNTTRSRVKGLGLGTAVGALVHSSATTVMLVGFVNAGLMTLSQAVPPILGANIGTTISMQFISFKLGAYCFFSITLGLALQMTGRSSSAKQFGKAILGFGLLFLGMNIMSDAIRPHHAVLKPFLENIDGTTLKGLWLGIGISAGLTAIWQSSGATIAICFALTTAGVFIRLDQVFPIVLGAHIGTCMTALLGCIGTNIHARRTAVAHLIFNLFNVLLAVVFREEILHYLPHSSPDLIRQTANLHTAVITAAALVILPVSGVFALIVSLVVSTRRPLPQPSYLDPTLLDRPEQAIAAVIEELQRVAKICKESFKETAEVILMSGTPRHTQQIKMNEKVINEIKKAIKEYLSSITRRKLSKRQAILIQHLNRCTIDIERIGDHIDAISDLSMKRSKERDALFDASSLEALFELYKAAIRVLRLIIDSLDPEITDFSAMARRIIEARDHYVEKSIETKAIFTEKVTLRETTPIAGIYYSEYIAEFDRIVRHSKTIALAESQPQFWVKRKKLERVAAESENGNAPEKIDPGDFLDKLHLEDYL